MASNIWESIKQYRFSFKVLFFIRIKLQYKAPIPIKNKKEDKYKIFIGNSWCKLIDIDKLPNKKNNNIAQLIPNLSIINGSDFRFNQLTIKVKDINIIISKIENFFSKMDNFFPKLKIIIVILSKIK